MSASALLAEVVSTAMYERNPFRVIGSPTDIGAREAARRAERLVQMQRFGAGESEVLFLTVFPKQGEEEIREAVRIIEDPLARASAELFWLSSAAYEIVGACGDVEETIGQLVRWHADGGASSAQHSLAVVHHAVALEFESLLGEGLADTAVEAAALRHWRAATRHWAATLESDEYWVAVEQRFRVLDDPRLTASLVRSLRRHLPEALVNLSTRMAIEAAARLDSASAVRHFSVIGQSRLAEDWSPGAYRRAVAEAFDRLSGDRERESPSEHDDPFPLARGLVRRAKALRALIEVLGLDEDAIADSARDTLASQLYSLAIEAANAQQRYGLAARLLELAAQTASNEELKGLAEENLARAKENGGPRREWTLAMMILDGGDTSIAIECAELDDWAGAIEVLVAVVTGRAKGMPCEAGLAEARSQLAICLAAHADALAYPAMNELRRGGLGEARKLDLRMQVKSAARHALVAEELDPENALIKAVRQDVLGMIAGLGIGWPSSVQLKVELGLATLAELISALRSSDDMTRVEALATLDRVFPDWPESAEATGSLCTFVVAIVRGENRIRSMVERVLERIDPEWECRPEIADVIPVAVSALGSFETGSREASEKVLERIGARAVDAVVGALRDPLSLKRTGAARVLGAIGSKSRGAVIALDKSLSDPDDEVRVAAASALGRFGSAASESIPSLLKLAHSNKEAVRKAACDALSAIEPGWDKRATELTEPPASPATVGRVGEASRDKGKWSQGILLALVSDLGSADPSERLLAIEALVRIGASAVDDVTVAFRRGPWTVSLAAAECLRRMGPIASSAAHHLRRELESSNEELRSAATKALAAVTSGDNRPGRARVPYPAGMDNVAPAARGPHPSVWARIVRRLGWHRADTTRDKR